MNTISQNLQMIRQRIDHCAHVCERDPKEITLIAVSKTKPVNAIETALAAGQRAFGENYVQEGIEKVEYFAQSAWADTIEWHFIGPLQANKSRLVAEHFHWLQTLDREHLAQRLHDQRPRTMAPLNVLIQINISDEASKSGITLAQLPQLAEYVSQLPHLKLRGLMAIPAPHADASFQLAVFQRMHHAFLTLQQRYPFIDTLSMGMSDDADTAIEAGSTMVRIGTAIFGQRNDS